MKISKTHLILFVTILYSQSNFIRTETLETKINKADVISEVIKFCIDKASENFCDPEYLKILINSAALQGKTRPIQDLNELEIERQKELERKRLLKIEQEKENQRQQKLKMEQDEIRQSYLAKIKDQDRMKQSEFKKYLKGHIKNDYDENGNLALEFENDF